MLPPLIVTESQARNNMFPEIVQSSMDMFWYNAPRFLFGVVDVIVIAAPLSMGIIPESTLQWTKLMFFHTIKPGVVWFAESKNNIPDLTFPARSQSWNETFWRALRLSPYPSMSKPLEYRFPPDLAPWFPSVIAPFISCPLLLNFVLITLKLSSESPEPPCLRFHWKSQSSITMFFWKIPIKEGSVNPPAGYKQILSDAQ